MFHLLTDQAITTLADIEVPYVAVEYDRGIFTEYGARQGCEGFDGLLRLHRESPDTFENLLQTWLFFGLLYEFCAEDLNMDDFFSTGAPPRISSSTLRRYCNDWFQKMYANDEIARNGVLRKVRSSLAFATKMSNEIDQYLQQDVSAAPRIMLSVKVLIESLTIVVKRFTLPLPEEDPYFDDRFPNEPEYIRPEPSWFLLDSMLQLGWCPYRLAGISDSISSIALYHLRGFCHADLIGENHQACTDIACRVDNLASYEPQHDIKCSRVDCELFPTQMNKVIEIYKGDDIPLLLCSFGPSERLMLDVIPSSKWTGYVAISHVWSDGLGNDQQNAVQTCQLSRLVKEVRALQAIRLQEPSIGDQEPVAFWLDTMCVPVAKHDDPEEYGLIKKIAIGRMDWTYAAADAVLIQDKALHKLSPDSLHPLQFAAHLHCSKWLSRCWTLAEGALAWKWHIQFSNSAHSLQEISLHFSEGRRQAVFDVWVENYRIQFPHYNRQRLFNEVMREGQRRETFDDFLTESIICELMSIYEEIPSKKAKLTFADAWNALRHRSTTKPGDAHGIFGLLTGLSIKNIISFDKSQRMKAVLNSQMLLPASILFNHGPKLTDEPKNRWVPEHVKGSVMNDLGYELMTYDEGRMIGPLQRRFFMMYKFQGRLTREFTLLDRGYQREFQIQILETDPRADFSREQEWLLIIPKGRHSRGLAEKIAFTAICVAIRREKNARILATWEYLVQFSCFQPRPSEPVIIEGHWIEDDDDALIVYLECDMTDWPQPTTPDWFSPYQKSSLPYIFWMAGDLGFIPGLLITLLIALVVEFFIYISELSRTRDEKFRGSSHILIATLVTFVVLAGLSIYYWTRKRRASVRLGEEIKQRRAWAKNFQETGPRRQSSLRLRFLLWLRGSDTNNAKPSGATHDLELNTESAQPGIALDNLRNSRSKTALLKANSDIPRSQNQNPGVSLGFPSTQSSSDYVRVIQVLLAIIELVVTTCFKYKQPDGDQETPEAVLASIGRPVADFIIFNSVVTPLATLYIWVELNKYTGSGRGEFGAYRVKISRYLEPLVMLLWFVSFVTMSAVLGNYITVGRRLGIASVVLAGLEWLIVIPLLLFRASNFLKYKAWPKHTRTLDDLFEDSRIEALRDPIEETADCGCPCCWCGIFVPVACLDFWIRVWQRIRRRRAGRLGMLAT